MEGIIMRHEEPLEVMDIFTMLIIVTVSWVYTYTKICEIVYSEYWQFIVYQLYLNMVF